MITLYLVSLIRIAWLYGILFAQATAAQTTSEAEMDMGPKGNAIGANVTKILESFFANGKYDARVRPNYGGPPVIVNVSMFFIGISSVSEVQMDFTCDIYFRQFWIDPRLAFKPTDKIKTLSVGAEVADRIWVPDTFFTNEKAASFHYATTKNTFLRIKSDGTVYRSIRLTVTANCPMALQYFPMDEQTCMIGIESYGYSTKNIIYKWEEKEGKDPIGMEKITLPQFRVQGYHHNFTIANFTTGNYSRLLAKVFLARSLGFYLIQIYIPASLIVVISWVSFWLHRNATPARVSLGVTTVLTMTTLMSSTNSQLPKISYIKSIDVFLGTCFVMVFASLLEYATVGYLGKRIAMRKSRIEQLNKMQEEQRKRALQSLPNQHVAPPNTQSSTQSHPQHPPPPTPQPVMGCGPHPPPPSQAPCDLPPPPDHHQHVPTNQPSEMRMLNPVCPAARNPRQVIYKHSHLYHPGAGGTLHRSGHYDRTYHCSSPPTSHRTTCASMRPCNAQHVICNHPENIGHHYPSEVRFKVVEGKGRSTSGGGGGHGIDAPAMTPLISRRSVEGLDTPLTPSSPKIATGKAKNLNKLLGVSPSDIDKYSRVIFPVCFICFNLMYWIIYLHISNESHPEMTPYTEGG